MDYNQFITTLGQIPWGIILALIGQGLILFGGVFTWIFVVGRHPVAVHMLLERSAGKPWAKKGARIVQNKDGTRYLKFLRGREPMPCPDLKFFHPNRAPFFCRPLRIYMAEDGVGQLHPFTVNPFDKTFVPENINAKFFYVNMQKRSGDLYNPVKSFIAANFTVIANIIGLVLCVVMVMIVTQNLKDMFIHTADVTANAMNNLASAWSSQAPPVPPIP